MKYLCLIFLILSTTSYAETPVHRGIESVQVIVAKLLKEDHAADRAAIIDEYQETLTEALELIRDYQYFKESRTIKLLKLQGSENELRATIIPFTMPPPTPFLGMFAQAPGESSVLPAKAHYPTGNYVWCTFHIQCIDKQTERFSIVFYQTFNGKLDHLGTFTHDIKEETPWSAVFAEILNAGLGAGVAQLFSSFAYTYQVPATHGSNISSQIAGINAFLVTYFSFTPHTFLEGTSLDTAELSKECEAFFLSLAGTAYLNPTSIDRASITGLWLFYLAVGTLKNSDFWFASTGRLEALQEWLQGHSTEILSAALASGVVATLSQYASHRQYIESRELVIGVAAELAQLIENL